MAQHSLDKGVPDCPECGGKGMCIEHRVEFLRHEYEVAYNAYDDAMREHIEILTKRIKERIEQK